MSEILKISLIIPLYNKEARITACLESALQQKPPFDEILVIDDGSTDQSAEKVATIKAENLRLIRQKNKGVCAARNLGIHQARNALLCFLDADDTLRKGYLETMQALIRDYPTAAFYSLGFVQIDTNTKAHPRRPVPPGFRGMVENYFKTASRGSLVNSSCLCVHKPIILEIGGFPEEVTRGEDLYTWARLAQRGDLAHFAKPFVEIHQFDDQSRSRRNMEPSYILTYYQNKTLKPDLKKYLRTVGTFAILGDLLKNNIKSAFVHIKLLARLLGPHCYGLTLLLLIPTRFWIWLKKQRRRNRIER